MSKKASKMSSQEMQKATDAVVSNKNPLNIPKTITEEEMAELRVNTVATQSTQLSQETVDALWAKHSNRGQMALEVVKSIVSAGSSNMQREEIAEYAFKVVDDIQAEIDRAYHADVMDAHVTATKNSQ
jgi:hypothetical protein